ncbi:disease resistance protein RPV1 [Trifolium repens]|nr:disease resistance protein RPV1 [Trifolium repens]
MISGSHNHRPGLYNCPLLKIAESHNLALSWMMKLIENPCHFRCGLDFVVHGFTVPLWFYHQFAENTRLRITDYMTEFDNWLGFAFCVAFVEKCCPTTSSSSHYSFSSQVPYPLYLSFESEQMEETFDMLLRLDLNKADDPKGDTDKNCSNILSHRTVTAEREELFTALRLLLGCQLLRVVFNVDCSRVLQNELNLGAIFMDLSSSLIQ